MIIVIDLWNDTEETEQVVDEAVEGTARKGPNLSDLIRYAPQPELQIVPADPGRQRA